MQIQMRKNGNGRRLALVASLAVPGALLVALAAPVAIGDVGAVSMGGGEADQEIVRVEEDWVLVLDDPESADVSPQFFTVLSPTSHLDGRFAQIVWNYSEFPSFLPGGLQIQAWDGDDSLDFKSFGQQELSTSAETITWTQSIRSNGIDLMFAIEHGESSTWGNFGGKSLAVLGDLSSNNLNNYSTAVSVQNSGVTYGANRVKSLTIVRVRRYSSTGLVSSDSTKWTVYLPE